MSAVLGFVMIIVALGFLASHSFRKMYLCHLSLEKRASVFNIALSVCIENPPFVKKFTLHNIGYFFGVNDMADFVFPVLLTVAHKLPRKQSQVIPRFV
jgi:hypothetical protein